MTADADTSPDSDWRDPRFVLRRLTRRPTAPLAAYAPPGLDAAARDRLRAAARAARAPGGPAVTFVLGVMPRSGTNYLERLLLTHPDACGAPGGLRELPALGAAGALERGFAADLGRLYGPNADLFARHEWLAYALAGYLNAARAGCPAEARMLLIKDPRVRNVGLFDAVLPDTRALIVLRDGRYLLDSTIRTWPLRPLGRTFEDLCLEWEAATRAALDYAAAAPEGTVRLVRYEDLVRDTPAEMAAVCDWLGLDPARLDAAALGAAPVLGSSTHSKGADGTVGWTPVARDAAFDPTGRPLDWSASRQATFARICEATQARAGYGG